MAGKAASEQESWWVLQAQSGSREAVDELFKSVQEPLYRYIVAVVKEKQLAEDILQEVFIRIYRKLRWLREPAGVSCVVLSDCFARSVSIFEARTVVDGADPRRGDVERRCCGRAAVLA